MNLTIRFFAWFPPGAPRGNSFPSVDDFRARCGTADAWATDLATWEDAADWRFGTDFPKFVDEMVAPRRPDVFILNFGIWTNLTNDAIGGDGAAGELIKSFRRSTARPIWRTTSPYGDKRDAGRSDAIQPAMEEAGIELHDVRSMLLPLTDRDASSNATAYWDDVHFKAFAYREVNLRLLHLIAHPPPPRRR